MGKICKLCDMPNEYPMNKMCKTCFYANTNHKKRTTIKRVSEKKKKRLKETGGEKPMFEKIYKETTMCQICGRHVPEPKSWCFAHILSKKDYPHLRNFTNNIAFVCSIECHGEVDLLIAGKNKKEIEQKILNGILFNKNDYE